MLCKYYLQLGCYAIDTESPDCMDVSSMIKNLDSIKVSYARVDLGGVVRKCGSSLEFTGKAYNAIIAHYEENYLQSKGVFAVYMADNNWNYSKVWECPLDFATLQYDANVVTIGCVDNSAAAIIKANKKSKYEFEVSGINDSTNLRYDGVMQRKTITFNVIGNHGEGDEMHDDENGFFLFNHGWYSIYVPGVGVASEYTIEGLEMFDQVQCGVDYYQTTGFEPQYIGTEEQAVSRAMELGKAGFIRSIGGCIVHVTMNITFRIESFSEMPWGMSYDMDWNEFVEYNFLLVIGNRIVWRQAAVVGYNTVSINSDFQMYAGEKMAFIISVRDIENGYLMGDPSLEAMPWRIGMHWASNSHTVSLNESHYSSNPTQINVVKPVTLLQNLANKIFMQSDSFAKCTIKDSGSILSRTKLVASESIRGITQSKIYSSFADFCKFMETVFGYIYTLEEKGYLMDIELEEIDNGTRTTLSHIKTSRLTNSEMCQIGGIISTDINEELDTTTMFNFAHPQQIPQVYYYERANVFVVKNPADSKYYTNFFLRRTMQNRIIRSSSYNDDSCHAREMIGLFFFTGELDAFMFYIIRDGRIVACDNTHTLSWLDSDENNKHCVELTFQHRTGVFKEHVIKKIQNVNNLSYQVDDSLVFSDIEVGYTKKDYREDNSAKNEYNFTNYYKTDSNITEETLSLICPYRADCYGIEELLNERNKQNNNNEATESDNDIFLVVTEQVPVDGFWKIDRAVTVQNAYTETVFNATIAPNKIVKNNEEYIGSFAKKLKFTSSDGNSRAVIGDIAISADINITKQLFKVGKISIDTDDHSFPETWDGLIEFAYAGKTYKGYLDSIDICFANLGTITYNIIEKCIE